MIQYSAITYMLMIFFLLNTRVQDFYLTNKNQLMNVSFYTECIRFRLITFVKLDHLL